jgi:flagellar hook assembly protein FlgD
VPEPNSGFVAVSGGYRHSLGLKADGSIVSWGNNTYGECDVPSPNEFFASISAGRYHSLGVQSIGTGIEPPVNTGVLAITSVHPNPTSGSATVQFNSPGVTGACLEVYDMSGHLMRTSLIGVATAGIHTTVWDGRDDTGAVLSSGVYLVRITGDGTQSIASRVVILR